MKFSQKIKHLIAGAADTAKALRQQSLIQHPGRSVKNLWDDTHSTSPIFVLSTGRAGTELLTTLFEASEKFHAHHEPEPTLNIFGKVAYEQPEEKEYLKGAFEGARYEFIRNATILNKTYVETNNRLTFLAPSIKELYPNARFIHLVREPIAFVKSGLQRNWYADANIHDEGRITMKTGWAEVDQVSKIAWLWAETNKWIYEFGKTVKPENRFFLKSEDLYSNPQKVKGLMVFCGDPSFTETTIAKLQQRPVNRSKKKEIEIGKESLNLINSKTEKVKELLAL